jgi:hypothetical protein
MAAPLTIRKNDAMTAGGQIIVRPHNEALPPTTFRVNIPVVTVRVSGSDPYRMSTWRLFPPARLPVISVSFIAVVSAYPDMVPAWTGGTMLADADRGTKPYYDLSMSRYPKRKAKKRGKNQFSHFLLLRLHEQVYGRHGFSLFPQQKSAARAVS